MHVCPGDGGVHIKLMSFNQPGRSPPRGGPAIGEIRMAEPLANQWCNANSKRQDGQPSTTTKHTLGD